MRLDAKLCSKVAGMIARSEYLNKMISKQNNGMVKIITGIRRCGKSYLLFAIYRNYLLENGKQSALILKD